MVDRQMFPAQTLQLAKRVQQLVRIDVVAAARIGIDILQRVNLERAPVFAGDDAARFVGRVAAREGDQLV